MPISAVVDTNILVSGLLRQEGQPRRLPAPGMRGLHPSGLSCPGRRVCSGPGATPAARRYGLEPEEARVLLGLIARQGVVVTPTEALPLPVLAAALGGGADYLVSGDQDLLTLAGDPRLGDLQIVTARLPGRPGRDA